MCIHVCDRCGPWSSVVPARSASLAIVKNMTRDTNLTNLTNNIQIVIHLIMERKKMTRDTNLINLIINIQIVTHLAIEHFNLASESNYLKIKLTLWKYVLPLTLTIYCTIMVLARYLLLY